MEILLIIHFAIGKLINYSFLLFQSICEYEIMKSNLKLTNMRGNLLPGK